MENLGLVEEKDILWVENLMFDVQRSGMNSGNLDN